MQWKAFFLSIVLLGSFVGMMYFLPTIIALFSPQVKIDFKPQQEKTYEITGENKPLDVLATVLPKFVMKLQDSKYESLWKAEAAEKKNMVESTATNKKGESVALSEVYDDSKKEITFVPKQKNYVKPGLYTLDVKIKTVQGTYIKITQDFTWGVIALNTNKGIYKTGENVHIGMGILDDLGSTKCIATGTVNFNTAKIWLEIVSPSGGVQKLSTDENTIFGGKECADKSVTNNPDFFTQVTVEQEGKYTIRMIAENVNGKRIAEDTFMVKSTEAPFIIERTEYPTRIYPRVEYPVKVSIKANKNYNGVVTDVVPSSFVIKNISQSGDTFKQGGFQVIRWNVNWKAGEIYTLEYTIKFPMIAPEFYIVGPIKIGEYDEGRSWQIASDALFTFVQEKHNTTSSGTSVSVTLNSVPVPNNLVILICSRTSSNSFTTPSGWSSAYNNSSGPRIYMYYRIAPVGMSQTVTCTAGTSGVLGIQVLEFSGNATSTVRDRRGRRNGISCAGGTMTSQTITPGNPDVLVVSAYSSTTARTVTGHSNSYVDSATSFNSTTGTFDSSWKEVINNPPVSTNTVATFSGNAGTCDNVIVSFNSSISISQGSFRFFDNIDNATPSAALAAQNTNITLPSPNYPFRLRMLLDVDSTSGNTMALGTGDFILQVAELPTDNNCLNGTYTPVATSSAIAYNPNPSLSNLSPIWAYASDPSDSGSGYTTIYENYMELYTDDNPDNDISNNQNSVANNQAGLWDFSLIENSQQSGSHTYCFIITDNAGQFLDAYRSIPRVTTNQVDVLIRGGTTIKGGNTGGTTLIR